MNERIAEAADYIAIRRLQCAYADKVNRHAWDEVCALFVPDAEIVVDRQGDAPLRCDATSFVAFIAKFIAPMDFFQFVILNTIIDIRGDEAAGRIYICEIRHDERAGQTMGYALCRDGYRKIDGKWLLASRHNRVMARSRTETYSVFPMTAADFDI